jgi:hypothetical protein
MNAQKRDPQIEEMGVKKACKFDEMWSKNVVLGTFPRNSRQPSSHGLDTEDLGTQKRDPQIEKMGA